MCRVLIDDLLKVPLDVKHLRERCKASGASGAAAYACTGQSCAADVTGDLLQAVQQRRNETGTVTSTFGGDIN